MWPKVSGLGDTWGPTSHQKCWLLELSSISLERTDLHKSPSHQLLPFVPFNLENWAGLKCVGFQTHLEQVSSVQSSLSVVSDSRDPINCSTPGLPVHHQLPEFTQTHVHRVSDAIQPSHPLPSPSPPAPNPSQHQGLFKWVNSSHEVAKVPEFQLQHQSFRWTPRADLL